MSTKADIKVQRGTKRACQNKECGARFYDLNRDPIACPICQTVYVVPRVPASQQARREARGPLGRQPLSPTRSSRTPLRRQRAKILSRAHLRMESKKGWTIPSWRLRKKHPTCRLSSMHPSMTKKKRLSGQSGTGWRAQAELSRSPLETLVANAVLTVAVYLAGIGRRLPGCRHRLPTGVIAPRCRMSEVRDVRVVSARRS